MLNQDEISAALDIAVDENGFRELIGMDPEQVAIDLANCNEEYENFETEQLLPFVKVWQASRR